MRVCGFCHGALRWDESYTTVQAEGIGIFQACPRCDKEFTGNKHEPIRYPPGTRVPKLNVLHGGSSDADIPICGLCRVALFEGDHHETLRLKPEDLADSAWEEYWSHVAEAKDEHRRAVEGPTADFQARTAAAKGALDGALAGADQELEENLFDALAQCATQAEYSAKENHLREFHEQGRQTAQALYNAAVALPMAELQAKVKQANFAYRQKAVATYRAMRDRFSERNGVEPGSYNVCPECLGKYRPRILERLIWHGIAPATLPEEAMSYGMLL